MRERDELYQRWLRQVPQAPETPPWKRLDFSQPSSFFSLLMCCDGVALSHINPTRDSVRNQSFPFWELHLVSSSAIRRERLRGMVRGLKRISVSAPDRLRLRGTHVAYLTPGDILDPHALFFMHEALLREPDLDAVYTDEDRIDERDWRFDPWFKPGWSPELLLSQNYVNRLCAVSVTSAKAANVAHMRHGNASDFDLLLRLAARGGRVHRCPRIASHVLSTSWRRRLDETRRRIEARLIVDHFAERGIEAKVESSSDGASRLVRFGITGTPIVSIIIPFKDKPELLERCVGSILKRTRYPYYEVVLVSNNSEQAETERVVRGLSQGRRIRAYKRDVPFNYSAINNWAARRAIGDYLLFLNNDTEVIDGRWLEFMLGYAQLPEIGAVGAKLLFPDGTIQHAGVILGMSGMASHIFSRQPEAHTYKRLASVVRNYLAVTGACLMVQQEKFWGVGGFDEDFVLCGGDVALCLSLVSNGYRNVYQPDAVLVHREKATRGSQIPAGDYTASFRAYQPYLKHGDPYYNPNLSLVTKDCTIRLEEEQGYVELEKLYGARQIATSREAR